MRSAVTRHTWLALAAGLVTAHADENAAAEYARLQGIWSFALVEVDGARQPEAPFENNKLVVSKDGRYTILQGSRITRGRLKLDPTQTPKHYDVSISEGPGKGQTAAGIYDVAGDTYKICLPLRSKDRPSGFVSKPGSRLIVFVFKREERDVGPALVEIGRQELTGTWQAVSYVLDGGKALEEDMKKIKLTIDASGQATALRDDAVFIAGTTKIDPTQDPMTLDVTYHPVVMRLLGDGLPA